MGITVIKAKVSNPANRTRFAEVRFTVDSGAAYSVVPASVLDRLGIESDTTQESFLANGDCIERRMGIAVFEYRKANGGICHLWRRRECSVNGRDDIGRLWLCARPLQTRAPANADVAINSIPNSIPGRTVDFRVQVWIRLRFPS